MTRLRLVGGVDPVDINVPDRPLPVGRDGARALRKKLEQLDGPTGATLRVPLDAFEVGLLIAALGLVEERYGEIDRIQRNIDILRGVK